VRLNLPTTKSDGMCDLQLILAQMTYAPYPLSGKPPLFRQAEDSCHWVGQGVE